MAKKQGDPQPCQRCAVLERELENKTHMLHTLEEASGQPGVTVVLYKTANLGQQREPGFAVAEVKLSEGVSLHWLVDAIRGNLAGPAND